MDKTVLKQIGDLTDHTVYNLTQPYTVIVTLTNAEYAYFVWLNQSGRSSFEFTTIIHKDRICYKVHFNIKGIYFKKLKDLLIKHLDFDEKRFENIAITKRITRKNNGK